MKNSNSAIKSKIGFHWKRGNAESELKHIALLENVETRAELNNVGMYKICNCYNRLVSRRIKK